MLPVGCWCRLEKIASCARGHRSRHRLGNARCRQGVRLKRCEWLEGGICRVDLNFRKLAKTCDCRRLKHARKRTLSAAATGYPMRASYVTAIGGFSQLKQSRSNRTHNCVHQDEAQSCGIEEESRAQANRFPERFRALAYIDGERSGSHHASCSKPMSDQCSRAPLMRHIA